MWNGKGGLLTSSESKQDLVVRHRLGLSLPSTVLVSPVESGRKVTFYKNVKVDEVLMARRLSWSF